MSHHLKLIAQLRECFREDSVSLFYHGDFDDFFTEKMITLIGFDSKNKIRGNLAFVIAESFQNVVRHKNEFLGKGNENVFGIRGRKNQTHVFSSNLVVDENQEELIEMLSKINSMSRQELKDAYMKILEEGELSDKGGAGMGLIEMARRSGNPIQYNFSDFEDGVSTFDMQIDFNRTNDTTAEVGLNLEENSILTDLITDNELLFIYKGEFSEKVLEPFLPIVDSSVRADIIDLDAIFKVAVGLVQNVEFYGRADENDVKRGLIALKKIPGGYYLCSGNYTTEDTTKLKGLVDDMNNSSKAALNQIYQQVSMGRSDQSDSVERVGLLNICRTSTHPIDLKLIEDDSGTYAMLGVKITQESTLS